MKKYIAPTVEVVSYKSEGTMLSVSTLYREQSTSDQLSNMRDDDFNSWED